ncbi:hypothetical protein Riv7116_4293 [Rivularia sp. PCC 7116]|uniref:hypothetical protein n=1 Tax=Rivularia sp. PCC 7116 TaxID=373994 RepID=UPI00029ED0C1|nr:hypothetical protein [Rivularia sp. PCC 7116]AFY56722.1 hypothetical protein Riv7116_4293 [Rivularia sp. PCC 7116]
MQEILSLIEEKNHEYAQLPLFKFLEDKTINPKQRLSFAPCIAHFIMSFGDLNKYVFREKQAVTKLEYMINEHTYEDDHHWPWFITDLEKLGFNSQISFTQMLRFLWSEHSKVSRQLSYQLSAYTLHAEPIIKIAAIEAIEATGNVLFSRTSQVASELTEITGHKYTYFGDFHLHLESGHAMGTEGAEDLLTIIELTDSQRHQAYEIVNNVFIIFTEWTHELLAYAQKQNLELDAYEEKIRDSSVACI